MACTYNAIQYGEYIFTGYVKSNLNKQAIYSDDGQSVKYIKCTLEVEFIISRELVTRLGTPPNPDNVVDWNIDGIRTVLLTPNLRLEFKNRGAGSQLSILGAPYTYTTEAQQALDFPLTLGNLIDGPYPEVLTWEPLGFNQAVKCRWRCTFNLPVQTVDNVALPGDTVPVYSEQPILGGRSIENIDVTSRSRTYAGIRTAQSIVNDYINTLQFVGDGNQSIFNYLVSVTEEQEVTIQEDGTVVVTLIGVIELTSGGAQLVRLSQPNGIPRLIQVLTHYFEPSHPKGFLRTQKYRFRKNHREFEYVITDTEQKSDNPLMPNIIKADVSHTVESSLFGDDVLAGSGFYTWNNTFNGSITVAPGVWMGWAWIAMMTIVKQRMNRTHPIVGETLDNVKDEIDSNNVLSTQNGQAKENKQTKPRHLLHRISVKENIYNRQVDLTLSYLVVTNLNNLFQKTGLFYPVHIFWDGLNYPTNLGIPPTNPAAAVPKSYFDQWSMSNEASSRVQNVFGYRGPLLPGYNMIFNPYLSVDINRYGPGGSAAIRNPEAYNSGPAETISGGVGDGNTSTTAYYRRANHLQTFGGLNFSEPTVSDNDKANVKEAPATPANSNPSGSFNQYYPGGDPLLGTSSYLLYSDPAYSWISYEPRFEVIQEKNAVMFPTIQSENPENLHTNFPRNVYTNRSTKGLTINGKGGSVNISDYQNSPVQSFGKPTTYVRFTGRAVRAGYPIPTPVLMGCQNRYNTSDMNGISVPAYQVGTAAWSHEMLNASSDVPVFCATWNILYALKGDPTCDSIGFQTSHASEYVS